MKKMKKKHIWLVIGAIIACFLLLYWLFAGTIIEEDSNLNISPEPLEQNM